MVVRPDAKCLASYRPRPFVPVEHVGRKFPFQRIKCIWWHSQGDKAVMESPQPDIVNGGLKLAQTPELPPPHLLLDLGVKQPVLPEVPDTEEPEEPQQKAPPSTEPTEPANITEPHSENNRTSAGTTDIRSQANSVKEDQPQSRGSPEPRNSPKSPPASKDEAVERRRRRVPSTPRASSGIPRLSGGNAEPTKSKTRTVSESRQRPKSELSNSRSSSKSTSRSTNFGYSRRPHSTVDGSRGSELPTSPTGDFQRTPRSSTSSLYSSSGGRRMEIKSKIGSLDNAKHQPGGGNVKIFSQKQKIEVSSKCGSKDFISHKPAGGNVQIHDEKLNYRQKAQSRVGSLEKANHKPAGGDVKIDNQKLKWEAKSKIGSLDNAKHKPTGGDKQIESVKLEFREKAASRVGSLDNAKHVPQGGDRKIKSYKEQYSAEPKVGSLDNANYSPGGGSVEIFSQRLPWLKFNRPNLPSAERRRIDKKGDVEMDSTAFDRARQKRYDLRIKGRSEPASFSSVPETNHRQRGLDVTDGPMTNDNRLHKANSDGLQRRANSNAALSPRQQLRTMPKNEAAGKSYSDSGDASSEKKRKKNDTGEEGDFDFVDGSAMPTSSTAQIGADAPSYNSTRAAHSEDDWKQPTPRKPPKDKGDTRKRSEDDAVKRKVSEDDAAKRKVSLGRSTLHGTSDLEEQSLNDERPCKSPQKSSLSLIETMTEASSVQQASLSDKENFKSGQRLSRGVKDLHLTEGYAERFKLLPPRPETEVSVRLSPLPPDPPPVPDWKKKAELKIDYDRDGHEMTLKTNLRASTKLPRVSDDAAVFDRPTGYMAEHNARTHRSPRRNEKKPKRIGTESLDRLLPSIDRLLDVPEPPSKVYSLYSNRDKHSPSRGRTTRTSNVNSEPLQPIQPDFHYDIEIDVNPNAYEHFGDSSPFPAGIETGDQLPPLPVDFVKSDGSAVTPYSSSISLRESAAGHRKRADFLKWRPGEVPFDKRNSSKPSYMACLSPHQERRTFGKPRKRPEGFADRYSQQRAWYEEYNERMRNRLCPEKVTSKTLEHATFDLC